MSTNTARLKHAERVLAMLVQEFPVFGSDRPLKIGVFHDLRAALPDINQNHLQRALNLHTNSLAYLRGLCQGGARYDLSGNPCGEIDPEQIEHAKLELAKLERRQDPVQGTKAPAPPREVTPIIKRAPLPSPASPPTVEPKPSSLADLREAARQRLRTEKV